MLDKLVGSYTYVLASDPAVDIDNWPQEQRAKYFINSFDMPPIKQGEMPTKFVLEPVNGKVMREINRRLRDAVNEDKENGIVNLFSDESFCEFVCAYGVVDVQNFPGLDKVERSEDKRYGARLSDDTMDNIFPFVQGLSLDLAALLLRLSQLRVI